MPADRSAGAIMLAAGLLCIGGCAGIPALQKAETLAPGKLQFGLSSAVYSAVSQGRDYGGLKIIPDVTARYGILPGLDGGVQLGLISAEADLKGRIVSEREDFPLALAFGAGAQILKLLVDSNTVRHSQRAFFSLYMSKHIAPQWGFCSSYRSVWSQFQQLHDYVGEPAYLRSDLISVGFYFEADPETELYFAYQYLWPGDIYGSTVHSLNFGVAYTLPEAKPKAIPDDRARPTPPPPVDVQGPQTTISLSSGLYGTNGLEYEHCFERGALALQVVGTAGQIWPESTWGAGVIYRYYLMQGGTARRGLWVGPGVEVLFGGTASAGGFQAANLALEMGWKIYLGGQSGLAISPKVSMGHSIGELKRGFFTGGLAIGYAF